MEDRRLAAIMFTDIVGYTALMGRDEDKAFKILRKNRDIQRPIIKKYRGEWLKEMGDGILASFHTSSDAVRCAGEIQAATQKAGIGLRIGIHEGEVVFEGGDVLGDGVNVASRLEELAEEGCINISGAVYKDIKNKAGITAEFIEEKTLKNVEEPVNVYRVHFEEQEDQETSKAQQITKKNKLPYYIIAGLIVIIAAFLIWQFLPTKETSQPTSSMDKTIAVIPFWDDSPDSDNAYFCSGMEEEIRIHLLKIADLKIESRQSVEKYRENPDIDAVTIGKELGVAFIVEGSVQKLEEDVTVRVQLIDAKSGDHIWAEIYDGNYTTKLLEFQRNTAKLIAAELNAVITPEEEQEIDILPTSDINAYDFMIRGWYEIKKYWDTRNTELLKLAHSFIDKALEIDPQYLKAITGKSGVFIAEQNFDSAYVYAKRALEIDPESAHANLSMGEYYLHSQQYDGAIESYLLALKHYKEGEILGSGLSKSYLEFILGFIYCQHKNDYQKGMPYLQKGVDDADEINYVHWGRLAPIFSNIGDYDRAAKYNRKLLESEYGICWGIANISSALIVQGKFNEAVNFLDSICGLTLCEQQCNYHYWGAYSLDGLYERSEQYFNQYLDIRGTPNARDSIWLAYMYKKLGRIHESNTLISSLHDSQENLLSGSKTTWNYLNLSLIHAILDENKETMEYLSKAVELGLNFELCDFLEINPVFENLWGDTEFKALVKRAQDEKVAQKAIVQEMIERGEIDM